MSLMTAESRAYSGMDERILAGGALRNGRKHIVRNRILILMEDAFHCSLSIPEISRPHRERGLKSISSGSC